MFSIKRIIISDDVQNESIDVKLIADHGSQGEQAFTQVAFVDEVVSKRV